MKNTIHQLIFLTIIPIVCSCSDPKTYLEQENKTLITKFEMNHDNEPSKNRFTIKAPKAILNNEDNNISIENGVFLISGLSGSKIEMESNIAQFDNLNKIFKASGEIHIRDMNKEDSTLTGKDFIWDIESSSISLIDNILLNNQSTVLSAEKAIYDLEYNKISFLGLNYYKYSPVIKPAEFDVIVKADSAIYSNKDNSITFKSLSSQVESLINFYK